MRRLAVVAAVGVAACTPVNATEPHSPQTTAPQATTLASAMVSLPIPTPAPAPASPPQAIASKPAAGDDRVRATATAAARASRGAARTAAPAPARVRPTGDVWSALAACESGGNPAAHGGGGRYHGAFQFSLATWRSLGYEGDPHENSYSVQLEAAQRLQARSGWGQWPRCARRLGLL